MRTKEEVIELMESSKSTDEWGDNCDKVKKEFDWYPSFWYKEIIISWIADKTLSKFWSDTKFHVTTF